MHLSALLITTLIGTSFFITPAKAIDWEKLNWKRRIQEDGITVLTAKVKGSPYIAVKTQMQTQATLQKLTALVMNAEQSKNWVDKCTHSTIHQRLSNTEYYQYFISKPQWPLKKRDFLLYVNISQDENFTVRIKAKADNTKYPPQKNIVRITQTQSLWKFTPLKNGLVAINHYAHVEPIGKIPSWLSNTIIIDTPLKTLRNMRNMLHNNTISIDTALFIQEP